MVRVHGRQLIIFDKPTDAVNMSVARKVVVQLSVTVAAKTFCSVEVSLGGQADFERRIAHVVSHFDLSVKKNEPFLPVFAYEATQHIYLNG